MIVSELIELLKKKPQDLQVVYCCYSEYLLMSKDDIGIEELCFPRLDGWVQDKRPDKPSTSYLVFPGN